jgi:hypothetical protein
MILLQLMLNFWCFLLKNIKMMSSSMMSISYPRPYVDSSTCLSSTYVACSLIELCQIVVTLS